MSKKSKRVAESYHKHNDDEISTARLLQMVVDDCGLEDISEAIDLLVEAGVYKPQPPPKRY